MVRQRIATTLCSRCGETEAPRGFDLCDQCVLKATAVTLNTASVSFTKKERRSSGRGGYKHISEALACEPEDVAEQRALFKVKGVGDVEHTPDGCPIFTSANQFQLATKALDIRTGRDGYDNIRKATGRDKQKRKDEVLKKWAAL